MQGAAAAAALQAWIPARDESLSPRQLVISVRITRGKFKMLPPLIHRVSLLHLTAGHCLLQKSDVPERRKIAIFSFYGDRRLDLYNTNMIVHYIQDEVVVHHQSITQSIVSGVWVRSYKSVKAHDEESSQQAEGRLRRCLHLRKAQR